LTVTLALTAPAACGGTVAVQRVRDVQRIRKARTLPKLIVVAPLAVEKLLPLIVTRWPARARRGRRVLTAGRFVTRM
jgi:hypothetical protein